MGKKNVFNNMNITDDFNVEEEETAKEAGMESGASAAATV